MNNNSSSEINSSMNSAASADPVVPVGQAALPEDEVLEGKAKSLYTFSIVSMIFAFFAPLVVGAGWAAMIIPAISGLDSGKYLPQAKQTALSVGGAILILASFIFLIIGILKSSKLLKNNLSKKSKKSKIVTTSIVISRISIAVSAFPPIPFVIFIAVYSVLSEIISWLIG